MFANAVNARALFRFSEGRKKAAAGQESPRMGQKLPAVFARGTVFAVVRLVRGGVFGVSIENWRLMAQILRPLAFRTSRKGPRQSQRP